MNIKDFKVGQTVYVELTGNAGRRKTAEECIEEWEITSVGRKVIKATKKGWAATHFEVDFRFNDYHGKFTNSDGSCVNYILYALRQEIEDKQERNKLFAEIRECFDYRNVNIISLDQLRRIKGIIDEVIS